MCTDFSIKAKARNNTDVYVVGRTMELGPNLKSKLFFRSVDYQFKQTPENSSFKFLRDRNHNDQQIVPRKDLDRVKGLYEWDAEYGFVAMNAFGQNIAANGMNTEGLTTGTMVLGESEFQPFFEQNQKVLNGENVIYYPNLTNWILSNCKDCQDVINKLAVNQIAKNLKLKDENPNGGHIVVNPFEKVPPAMKFHFPVHDAKGNSIVLEYVDGALTVSNLKDIGVLTNDPLIAWQQENVKNNYIGIMPFNVQDSEGNPIYRQVGNNFSCKSNAQGTGFEGLPGSSTPVDRFVRAAMMSNFSFPVTQITKKEYNGVELTPEEKQIFESQGIQTDEIGLENATTLAFHILNTVDIPMGTSRDPLDKTVHDYTQWATVSDLTNRTYAIRMYNSPQVFSLNMDALDLKRLENEIFPIPTGHKSIDITDAINETSFSKQEMTI